MMDQSILTSTKKILGIPEDYTVFDLDVLTHINAAFSTLTQLGIGPPEGFFIEDKTAEWDDYSENVVHLGWIRTYIYLKVRYTFDPPTTSYLIAATEKQIQELEWRLNVDREEGNWAA